jgi:hypothetical protein
VSDLYDGTPAKNDYHYVTVSKTSDAVVVLLCPIMPFRLASVTNFCKAESRTLMVDGDTDSIPAFHFISRAQERGLAGTELEQVVEGCDVIASGVDCLDGIEHQDQLSGVRANHFPSLLSGGWGAKTSSVVCGIICRIEQILQAPEGAVRSPKSLLINEITFLVQKSRRTSGPMSKPEAKNSAKTLTTDSCSSYSPRAT